MERWSAWGQSTVGTAPSLPFCSWLTGGNNCPFLFIWFKLSFLSLAAESLIRQAMISYVEIYPVKEELFIYIGSKSQNWTQVQ